MARSSGGGRPSSRSSTRSSRPQTVKRAPTPARASNGDSLLGSIARTVVEGFAFSTGSAVAHRVFDAIMGPRKVQHEISNSETAQPAPPAPTAGDNACGIHSQAFQDCLNNYGSEISRCQFYLDMLTECKRNSGVMGAENLH
ncbi:hypothetical protein KSS87_003455 [Heliosperma pusillum]|nr:hypothetical protein KSS87_003455 [Heliosperma pusillum]